MKVGITTTIPVEILFAAGATPVDLNNAFITTPDRAARVDAAEVAGYPRTVCGWIKGIYSTVVQTTDLRTVVAVTQGDCSNTHALMETLQVLGINIIPFAFPYDRDPDVLRQQMDKLITRLGTTWKEAEAAKKHLDGIRAMVHEIDRLTWEEGRVSGWDNHLYQVSTSDFNGDPTRFAEDAAAFIEQSRQTPPRQKDVRIGFIGVPPITDGLYEYLESLGVQVVFNEVQRQFSMPFATDDLVTQYQRYTYPYDVFGRIADINAEVKRRDITALIHYTQSFCFRQIEDLILRKQISVPLLTIEGDRPGALDARTQMRIEAFLDLVGDT